MSYKDPTAYPLGGNSAFTDPQQRFINGWSNHGGLRIEMPFITQVADNLWHGGVEDGLVLPEFIEYKLSLYPWEDYTINHDIKETKKVQMYDSIDQGFDQIQELALWVNEKRKDGPVLVHCQAGLNRSSLVVAAALVASGEAANGQEAVDLIREKRSEACLCNPAFEAWVQKL